MKRCRVARNGSRPLQKKKSINRVFPPVGQAVDGVFGFNEAVFIIGVGIGGVGPHHAGGTALQVFFGLFLAAGDGVGQCFLGDFSNLFILIFQSKHSFRGRADDEHRPLRWGIPSIK